MRKHLAIKPALTSFLSEKDDLAIQRWVPCSEATPATWRGPDLVGMAKWSMHYLLHNPQKPRGYECRFSLWPLRLPPAPADDQHDAIVVGDTESRMELAFVHIRNMTGLEAGREVEDAIRTRLKSYVRQDGLCWCSPRCLGGSDTEPAAMSWTTAHLLRSTAERYLLSGDEREHHLCRRLVEGLKRLATRRGNLAWYEGGLAAWRDGKWLLPCQHHAPTILDALVRYWEISRETDVLEFAEAMAEGILADVQTSIGVSRIEPDGSHRSSNCHLVMRTTCGVARLGAVTSNSRYIEWARRVYEFTRSGGTDWGWCHENFVDPQYRYHSETCVTGDMAECAVALAQAGYPEYWDHVERIARNYLPEAQFFLTPEFEALYRKTHAEKKPAEVEKGLQMLRKFEGGFVARLRPNDWVYRYGRVWEMNMMGCCPPEGMRALYLAWLNTVVEEEGAVHVNMALDRESPTARVTTEAPQRGRLAVEALKAADYFVRPPSWAPQGEVRAFLNGKPFAADWHRGYLRFRGVKAGDKLQLEHPMPLFTQRIPIGCERSEEFYDMHWIGNDVHEVLPRGEHLPIFSGTRRALPTLRMEE
jgi:hypothetical protein